MKTNHHEINIPEFVNIIVLSTRGGLGVIVLCMTLVPALIAYFLTGNASKSILTLLVLIAVSVPFVLYMVDNIKTRMQEGGVYDSYIETIYKVRLLPRLLLAIFGKTEK